MGLGFLLWDAGSEFNNHGVMKGSKTFWNKNKTGSLGMFVYTLEGLGDALVAHKHDWQTTAFYAMYTGTYDMLDGLVESGDVTEGQLDHFIGDENMNELLQTGAFWQGVASLLDRQMLERYPEVEIASGK